MILSYGKIELYPKFEQENLNLESSRGASENFCLHILIIQPQKKSSLFLKIKLSQKICRCTAPGMAEAVYRYRAIG